MRGSIFAWARSGFLAAGLMLPAAANAGTKDFGVAGYALPADKPVTIVLMRPDVDVGELQAGGLPQPNADWTKAARDNLTEAFRDELQRRNVDFRTMESRLALRARQAEELQARCTAAATAREAAEKAAREQAAAQQAATDKAAAEAAARKPGRKAAAPAPVPEPTIAPAAVVIPEVPAECAAPATPARPDETVVADYTALHGAVVQSILEHKYGLAGKLPTKKQDFDYTLGSGAAALGQMSGANYGLFVLTYDQFASASRKSMQVAGMLGCLVGVCVIVGGGRHDAYASLIELETGRLVWFNLVRGSKGDVREAAGAHGLATAILATMPTRPGAQAAAVPGK